MRHPDKMAVSGSPTLASPPILRLLLASAAAATASASASASASGATTVCAPGANGGAPPMDNTFMHAACADAGATIAAVVFASYGTATVT